MTDTILGHDSRAVANEILKIAHEKKLPLTIMQLLKLAFFAHGWTLALLDKPLSRQDAEAWRYGPVFSAIYNAYPGNGSAAISHMIADKVSGVAVAEQFDADEQNIIKEVIDGYGKLHAFQLSNLTHAEGSPWDRTVKEKGVYASIPNEWIKEYFTSLKKK